MVKPVAKAEISSFVKGIITEASPLNFPADASRDEENFILNNDGSRQRRLGLDFEDGHVLRSTGLPQTGLISAAHTSYRWLNAGNDALNEFAVIQFGTKIDIFDTAKTNISGDGFLGSVTLSGVSASVNFSYATVDGALIIAANTEVIHIIQYDNPNFLYTTRSLLVRDLWGIEDTENNEINTRPITLNNGQLYNRRNQGWGLPRKNQDGILSDPLIVFNNTYSKYPANSEVVYTGLQFQAVADGEPYERIFTNLYDDSFGLVTSNAAKGYFIIDALKRGTSRFNAHLNNQSKFPVLILPITSLPADQTSGGCSLVADFSGRIFFSGFQGDVIDGDNNSPILSSYVLFSQVVKSKEDIVKCYQVGDPTSRENVDLVDTDGGFIRISGAKQITGLVSLSNNLFVIADNGVWSISGGSDYGFSATNYSVKRISNFGCDSPNSIVLVNNQIFFFGESGIFVITQDQFGTWNVISITEKTIQSFYDDISAESRINSRGIYDIFDKKIRWIIDQDLDKVNNNIVRELIFDTQLNAFTVSKFYNLSIDTPSVIGFMQTASFISQVMPEDVEVGEVDVFVGINQVVISSNRRISGLQSVKYITLHGSVGGNVGYSFSQYVNTDFRDWFSVDNVGVDAYGFMLTGIVTARDSSSYKQSPYITVHMLKTEDGVVVVDTNLIPSHQSSCLLSSQWDWANTSASNKFGQKQQAYRYRKPLFITGPFDSYDNGFEVVSSKNKLRGRGKALSLLFETEPNKDCHILGWNLEITGNNR